MMPSSSNSAPPVITSSPVTAGAVGAPYSYAVEATDPDGDSLTYTLTSAPLGMNIDAASGVIVWTPITGGDYAATVTVDDGNGGTDDQSFVIHVTVPSGANPPGLDPVGDQTVMLGTKLELQLTASDADGDTLTFALSPVPLPAGMTLNAATGELTFKPQTAATYQLTVVATDGRFTDQETITVTVPPPIPGAPTSFAGRNYGDSLLNRNYGITELRGITVTVY